MPQWGSFKKHKNNLGSCSCLRLCAFPGFGILDHFSESARNPDFWSIITAVAAVLLAAGSTDYGSTIPAAGIITARTCTSVKNNYVKLLPSVLL
jgi:hypothetical protein